MRSTIKQKAREMFLLYCLKLYQTFNYQVMINYAMFRCIYTLPNAALLFFIIVLTTHDSLIDFLYSS